MRLADWSVARLPHNCKVDPLQTQTVTPGAYVTPTYFSDFETIVVSEKTLETAHRDVSSGKIMDEVMIQTCMMGRLVKSLMNSVGQGVLKE